MHFWWFNRLPGDSQLDLSVPEFILVFSQSLIGGYLIKVALIGRIKIAARRNIDPCNLHRYKTYKVTLAQFHRVGQSQQFPSIHCHDYCDRYTC